MSEPRSSTEFEQLAPQGPVLFLLDARFALEQRILEQRVRTLLQAADEGAEIDADSMVLSVSRENRRLPLVELAEKLNRAGSTKVIPLRVSWRSPLIEGNKPLGLRHLLFGDPRRPGAVRASFMLQRDKQAAQCLAGEPATISELQQRYSRQANLAEAAEAEEFAAYVARQANLTLDAAERRLRGSRYKVPHFVAESLRANRKFRHSVKRLASELDRPVKELELQAQAYMKEIIAVPNALFIDLRARFDRFVLSLGYEKDIVYDTRQLQQLRRTMQEHPTLLLFTHKTYLDGIVLPTVLYKNDFPMLHMFSGVNLNFAGLGYLLRHSGAIFLRRTFQDNPLYKLVMRQYIGYLMEKRFPMTWAFEGTRSRVGKLMPPRLGLLKYVLEAAHATEASNIHVIPVVISYDLIRDVDEYATEQSGRIKSPETLKWMIGYVSSLRNPMGKIYMDLGEAVVLPQAPPPEDPLALSKIAFEVAVQANRATPITLPSLVCLCLLGAAPRALTTAELQAEVLVLAQWARDRNISICSDFDPQRPDQIRGLARIAQDSGLLIRYDQGSSTVYAIDPKQHPIASYYRNTVIHHFLHHAMLELALLSASEVPASGACDGFWREIDKLRNFFKFEFFYPSNEEFRHLLQEELARNNEDWQQQLQLGGQALKSLLNDLRPWTAHAILLTFVEAYSVVFDLLARLPEEQGLEAREGIPMALREGKQAYLQRRITSEASIGKILFQNAFALADNLGVSAGGAGVGERRNELLREFRQLSQRLEKLRVDSQSGYQL